MYPPNSLFIFFIALVHLSDYRSLHALIFSISSIVCRFVCQAPDEPVPLTLTLIFGAVALESFFWGMGTAFGELPPYFVARAGKIQITQPFCPWKN